THPKIGLNFVRSLRHILRQDPDIIMVGEIRDVETARMSIQASLTGHLVLSTLHTNDAASTVTRLLDMGIEAFLITSTLNGVIAQRLVRKLCQNCKEIIQPTDAILKEINLFPKDVQGKKFYVGKGCNMCNNTGYKGRTGLYEILKMDDEIKHLIINRASTAEIREQARKNGMILLREDGIKKVFDGITTLEEIIKETRGYF
ncbi:Flp pilus assembly complex ATPase component TadA, partial [bacterium]|nr:Flp pilus assembly complex ATPase component TadA [bacterium]